jgi:4-aminobutyrate aminotransferase-like enzyme
MGLCMRLGGRRVAHRSPAVGATADGRRRTSSLVRASRRAEGRRQPLPTIKQTPLSLEENVQLRATHLPGSLRCHYENTAAGPLKLASGLGQYLYDQEGNQYLDCVNNVCHVGHCHPRVVQAAATQLSMLNTNSRYLHDNIVRLAQEITQKMPDPLSVAFFVNSGTEATELALRLARNHSQRRLVYCVDGAYHGNSAAALAISPYNKYASDADSGSAGESAKLMLPDVYQNKLSDAEMTAKAVGEYAAFLEDPADAPAAYIVESMMCCGGQIILPDGYLKAMTKLTRAHGETRLFFSSSNSFWDSVGAGALPRQARDERDENSNTGGRFLHSCRWRDDRRRGTDWLWARRLPLLGVRAA